MYSIVLYFIYTFIIEREYDMKLIHKRFFTLLAILSTLLLSGCFESEKSNSSTTSSPSENLSSTESDSVSSLTDWLQNNDMKELADYLNSGYPEQLSVEFSIASNDTLVFICQFEQQLSDDTVCNLKTTFSEQLTALEPSFLELVRQYHDETNGLLNQIELQYKNADGTLIYTENYLYSPK